MTQVERQKMCWNCDADVSLDATYCPFCGTDLLTTTEVVKERSNHAEYHANETLQESLASLYKPPYSVRNQEGLGVPNDPHDLLAGYRQEKEEMEMETETFEEEDFSKMGGGWPLVLLSVGSFLFTFGALLLFLSKNGKLVLEWKASFWFVYCFTALPLLVFGFRALSVGRKGRTTRL